MNSESNTNTEAIRDLAVAASNVVHAIEKDGTPFFVVPQNYRVEDLEKFLPSPLRVRANREFVALESFNRYVKQFKETATRITVSRSGNAVAILDGSAPTKPSWEAHTAKFNVTHSAQWAGWVARNKQAMTQKQFAEFIEDNNPDFLAPAGAAMLDIALTLQAEQSSTFNSAVRLSNGDVQFGYKRTTVAKAGNGELEIPSEFTIQVPILEAESPRQIPVRLRYDLSEGKLTLTYEILRLPQILDEVRRSIYATITNETGVEPLLVA